MPEPRVAGHDGHGRRRRGAAAAGTTGTTTGTTDHHGRRRTSTSTTTTQTSPTNTTTTPGSTGGAGGTSDKTAPRLKLTKVTVTGLGRHAATVRFTTSEAGKATGSLSARGTVLARGTKTYKKAGKQTLTLKVTNAGRAALRRAPRLKATLRLTVRDAAGNTAKLTRALTIAR